MEAAWISNCGHEVGLPVSGICPDRDVRYGSEGAARRAGGLHVSGVTRRTTGTGGESGCVAPGAVGGDGVPVPAAAWCSLRGLGMVGAGAPSALLGAGVARVPVGGWRGGKRGEVVIQYRQRPAGRGLPGSGNELEAQPVE